MDRHRHLPVDVQASAAEIYGHCFLVNGFEESMAERIENVEEDPDDPLGDRLVLQLDSG